MESAEKLKLCEIRFDVNMPAMREGFHGSWNRDDRSHSERLWSLGMPLSSKGRVIGRLAIVGETDTAPLAERLDEVVEMIDSVEAILDDLDEDAIPVTGLPHTTELQIQTEKHGGGRDRSYPEPNGNRRKAKARHRSVKP